MNYLLIFFFIMNKMCSLYHPFCFLFFYLIYLLMIDRYIFKIFINFHLIVFALACFQIFYFLRSLLNGPLFPFSSPYFFKFINDCCILAYYFMNHLFRIYFYLVIHCNICWFMVKMKIDFPFQWCCFFSFQIKELYFFS